MLRGLVSHFVTGTSYVLTFSSKRSNTDINICGRSGGSGAPSLLMNRPARRVTQVLVLALEPGVACLSRSSELDEGAAAGCVSASD